MSSLPEPVAGNNTLSLGVLCVFAVNNYMSCHGSRITVEPAWPVA